MTSNAEHVKPWVPPALGYPKAISFPWPFHPVALLLFLTNTTSLATSQWKSVHVSKRSVQMMHPTKIKDQHLKHLAFVGPHLNPSLKPKEARTGRRFLFQPQGRSYGPMALINMLAMISMSLELHHAHTFTPSGCKGFSCQRQQNCIKPVRSYSTNTKTEFSTHAMGKETAMWRSQWTLLQVRPPTNWIKAGYFSTVLKKNQQKFPLQGLVGSNVGLKKIVLESGIRILCKSYCHVPTSSRTRSFSDKTMDF